MAAISFRGDDGLVHSSTGGSGARVRVAQDSGAAGSTVDSAAVSVRPVPHANTRNWRSRLSRPTGSPPPSVLENKVTSAPRDAGTGNSTYVRPWMAARAITFPPAKRTTKTNGL